MPENDLLPNAWWYFWWGIGLLVTIILTVWFIGAARRAERLTGDRVEPPPVPEREPPDR